MTGIPGVGASRLADCVVRGDMLDLAGDGPVDENAMRSWDEARTVQAGAIREILCGRTPLIPDPHGVRLRGARIAGCLDLENLRTPVWLELTDCFLPEGLVARDAVLPGLVLEDCLIEGSTEPALDADRLAATAGLFFSGTVFTTAKGRCALGMSGAHIGDLDCSGGRIRNGSGPAVTADDLRVERDVWLGAGFEAVGTDEYAAVSLLGAQIGGLLNCDGGKFRNEFGSALVADGLRAARDVWLGDGFEAVGAGSSGAVRLVGAQVGGQLSCSGGSFHNDSGFALTAENLRADGEVLFGYGSEAVGAGGRGAVNLFGAQIGGELFCDGGKFRNDSGPAVLGDGLRVGGDASLGDGLEAVGAGERGAVRLVGAQIGGSLYCAGGRFRNSSGPSIAGAGMRVDRDVMLTTDFEAFAGTAGEYGAVNLLGAQIGGRLDCAGGKFRSDSGPALIAENLRVHQNAFLRTGFEATGAGEYGAVRLLGARIGGQLDCSGGRFRNESGPALVAENMRVEQNLFLGEGFEVVGGGDTGALDLTGAQVGGSLVYSPDPVENLSQPGARFELDGLTYSGIPVGPTLAEWLGYLREGSARYAAQPYQQLAAGYRAAGQDGDVRKILMAQRRDQLDRNVLTGRAERGWARLTGLTLGYGYQPWRALISLLAVLAIAVALSVGPGAHGALERTGSSPTPGEPCSTLERIGVGLDLGLPLIKTGARDHCDVSATTAGQRLAVAGWVLQLLAWAFATLFIAGFTSAVRKT